MGYAAMHDTDWDDLRYFLAVDTKGSVSGAARHLGTSHSTVLRRLASLEKKLGARLLERRPNGYTMTGAGQRLRERLSGVAERIEGAQRELSGLDARPTGTIRVTSTDTLMHGLLPPLLADFRRLHPGVQLQVVVNNTFLSLTKREADVAIRPSNRPPEYLVGRKVGSIQTALYASKAYWKAHGRKPLAEQEWVVPDESLAHLAQAKWAAGHVSVQRAAATVDSLLGMARAVRAGMGVGMLLTLLGDADDQLVRIGKPDPQLDTSLWILTHADLKHVSRIRLFTDFMHERLRLTEPIVTPRRIQKE
jgi:DNA-binding transcriptional LysR family regulator